jgi:hypothetical protein
MRSGQKMAGRIKKPPKIIAQTKNGFKKHRV